MTQLINAIPIKNSKGDYNYKVVASTGTSTLQYQVADEGFSDIPSSLVTDTSTGVTVELPDCDIQAVITGDAVVYLSPI